MAASLGGVRFLIVDDNVHMLNIIKTILRGFGARPHRRGSQRPREALNYLHRLPVDIIILDYLMDGEDRVAFLRRLRRRPDKARRRSCR